jgi:hypothetical protein
MLPDVIVFLSSVLTTVGPSLWGGGVSLAIRCPYPESPGDQLNWTVYHRMSNQRGCLKRTTGYGIQLWTLRGERTYVKTCTFNRRGQVYIFCLGLYYDCRFLYCY